MLVGHTSVVFSLGAFTENRVLVKRFTPDLYLTWRESYVYFLELQVETKKSSKLKNFRPSLFSLFSLVEKNCTAFLKEGETGTKITDTKDFSSTLVCRPKTEFVLIFLQSFSYINNSISCGKSQVKVVSWPTSPISAQPIKCSAVMITLYSVVQQMTYRIYASSNKYLVHTTVSNRTVRPGTAAGQGWKQNSWETLLCHRSRQIYRSFGNISLFYCLTRLAG